MTCCDAVIFISISNSSDHGKIEHNEDARRNMNLYDRSVPLTFGGSAPSTTTKTIFVL